MWVSRRHRTCILLCGLALCLMILNFAYGFSNIFNLLSYFTLPEPNVLPLTLHCNTGRLGNQMCTFATLYGISALNRRQFISLPCNVNHLKDIFVGPSKRPTKDIPLYLRQNSWKLLPYLRLQDAAIPPNTNFLNGFKNPCSFTFFDHVRDGIRKEFQFHEHFNRHAQTILHRANQKQLNNPTFVGVHVRRGDYKKNWLDRHAAVPVNMEYFRQAFQYFQEKYKNVVFIAVSDDRLWCLNKLSRHFGVYVPGKAPSPAHDLAILSNCNHTIMTYGTFGFWGAYLAGGEVLYFDKFLKPNTSYSLKKIYEKIYPPYWKCIVTVNVSNWFQENTNHEELNALPLTLHCNIGRLGNQMCTYATLYGISALNRRQFIPLPCNANHLKDIFIGPSKVPTKFIPLYLRRNSWKLFPYLRPQDAAIPLNSNFLNGFKYPCSFTFFDHVRDGIRKEFQFHEHFNRYAQTILHRANRKQLNNPTFVGVHVRRGDYKKDWLERHEAVPVNMKYFRQAFRYFQEKYKNVVFIAISDDRLWCLNKLSRHFGVYVPEKAPSPAHDLAILSNCNHTIMTYGTFGFWGAYLAGGEVLYFDKFLKPNTSYSLKNFVFEKMYPPYWKGIVTVNVSNWFQEHTNHESKNVTLLS